MEISEPNNQKYYVQYYDTDEWKTLDKYTYYVDAVVYLGKCVEAHPETDHRVLRVISETAIEVPSLETEKLP